MGNSSVATFSRGLAEPVKIWDIRKFETCVGEIKPFTSRSSSTDNGKELPTFVSAIAWDASSEGVLCISTGDDLRFYNTRDNTRDNARINLTRPVLSTVTHSDGPLQCISFQPKDKDDVSFKPQRLLAVYNDGTVTDLPTKQVAPVAFSSRDGRNVSAFGANLFVGSTSESPAAMEKPSFHPSEDISARMMRRARCLHMKRYSTDATSNLEMLSLEQKVFLGTQEEQDQSRNELNSSLEHLHLLWSWIERVENLCFRNSFNSPIDAPEWTAKTLCDAGVLHILKLDVPDINEITTFDSFSKSDVFNRNVYDSPSRRYVMQFFAK